MPQAKTSEFLKMRIGSSRYSFASKPDKATPARAKSTCGESHYCERLAKNSANRLSSIRLRDVVYKVARRKDTCRPMSKADQSQKANSRISLNSVKSCAQRLFLLKTTKRLDPKDQDEALRQAAIIKTIEELVDECLNNHRN